MLQDQQLEAETLAEVRDLVPEHLAKLGDAVFSQAAPEPEAAALWRGLPRQRRLCRLCAQRSGSGGICKTSTTPRRFLMREQLLARDGDYVYRQMLQAIRREAAVTIDRDLVQDPGSVLEYGLQ